MQQISIHRIYIHIRICVLLYTAVSVKRITLKRTVNTFGGNGAWRHIYQRSVLWFADNESARMALIRNYSPVIDNFLLLQVNSQLDLRVEKQGIGTVGCPLRVILQMLHHVCRLSHIRMPVGLNLVSNSAWTVWCNSRSLRNCWKGEVCKPPCCNLDCRSTSVVFHLV